MNEKRGREKKRKEMGGNGANGMEWVLLGSQSLCAIIGEQNSSTAHSKQAIWYKHWSLISEVPVLQINDVSVQILPD